MCGYFRLTSSVLTQHQLCLPSSFIIIFTARTAQLKLWKLTCTLLLKSWVLLSKKRKAKKRKEKYKKSIRKEKKSEEKYKKSKYSTRPHTPAFQPAVNRNPRPPLGVPRKKNPRKKKILRRLYFSCLFLVFSSLFFSFSFPFLLLFSGFQSEEKRRKV